MLGLREGLEGLFTGAGAWAEKHSSCQGAAPTRLRPPWTSWGAVHG